MAFHRTQRLIVEACRTQANALIKAVYALSEQCHSEDLDSCQRLAQQAKSATLHAIKACNEATQAVAEYRQQAEHDHERQVCTELLNVLQHGIKQAEQFVHVLDRNEKEYKEACTVLVEIFDECLEVSDRCLSVCGGTSN